MVPQIPAKRWTGIAPTTSSILNLSSIGIVKTTINPPTAPMNIASIGVGASGSAVIATSPPNAPFKAIVKSVFL